MYGAVTRDGSGDRRIYLFGIRNVTGPTYGVATTVTNLLCELLRSSAIDVEDRNACAFTRKQAGRLQRRYPMQRPSESHIYAPVDCACLMVRSSAWTVCDSHLLSTTYSVSYNERRACAK